MDDLAHTYHSNDHCDNCYNTKCNENLTLVDICPIVACKNRCGALLHGCKLEDHYEVCGHEKVVCINQIFGCPKVLRRLETGSHLESCPASVVYCNICGDSFRRHEFSAHYGNFHDKICSLNVCTLGLNCPLATYGCGFTYNLFLPCTIYTDAVVVIPPYLFNHFELKDYTKFSRNNDTDVSKNDRQNVTETQADHPWYYSEFSVEKQYKLVSGACAPQKSDWSVIMTFNNDHIERHEDNITYMFPAVIWFHICGFLDAHSLDKLSRVNIYLRNLCSELLENRGMVLVSWDRIETYGSTKHWEVTKKAWKFSKSLSPIRRWSGLCSTLVQHLKVCEFNTKTLYHEPVRLTGKHEDVKFYNSGCNNVCMKRRALAGEAERIGDGLLRDLLQEDARKLSVLKGYEDNPWDTEDLEFELYRNSRLL